jgi:hypothetical protein
MKKILLGFALIALIASCKKENSNPHVANANCGSCHSSEKSQWSDVADLHALASADVLTNVDHNTTEILNDDCLKCHSTFQYKKGVAHFVTPADTIGSPAGTWTLLNSADWQATKCEVCHNPNSTNKDKLAKYGSILDGEWNADYTSVSDLPEAYQNVLDRFTSTISTYVFPNQTSLSIQATKLCNSCHDPADQGGDPEIVIDGVNFGSQGGDSRSFVLTNHKGIGCIDCHDSHTFIPVDPMTTLACNGCHVRNLTGKVHINHM